MNVRKGDLAYVTSGSRTPGLAGRFVIVEEFFDGPDEVEGDFYLGEGGPSWVCRSAQNGGRLPVVSRPYTPGQPVKMRMRRVIMDEILRPIRDPGDDAVDKVLRHLEAVT